MSVASSAESEDLGESLASRLRMFRRSNEWSQQRLAEEVGTNQQTVGRWERGQSPQRRFRPALADLLAVELEDLERIIETDDSAARLAGLPSVQADPPTKAQEAVLHAIASLVEDRAANSADIAEHETRLLRDLLRSSGLKTI